MRSTFTLILPNSHRGHACNLCARVEADLFSSFAFLFSAVISRPSQCSVSERFPECSDTVPEAPHLLHPIDGVLWDHSSVLWPIVVPGIMNRELRIKGTTRRPDGIAQRTSSSGLK